MADKLEAGRALGWAVALVQRRLDELLAAYNAAQEHDCESRIDREQCDRMTEQAATLATDNARLREENERLRARDDCSGFTRACDFCAHVQAEREAIAGEIMDKKLRFATDGYQECIERLETLVTRIRRGNFAQLAQREGEDD